MRAGPLLTFPWAPGGGGKGGGTFFFEQRRLIEAEEESGTSGSILDSNQIIIDPYDIGNFVGDEHKVIPTTDECRYKVLIDLWKPPSNYNFKSDVCGVSNRAFRYQWLGDYPFISYSAKLKGVFCRNCVLFRPQVHCGLQVKFIVKLSVKYKDFHNSIRDHINFGWHRQSTLKADIFIKTFTNKAQTVIEQIDSSIQTTIMENRQKLLPILKTITFCGTNGVAIRGKTQDSSIFRNLLSFRVDAGDQVLSRHLETSSKNAQYISHRVQNELIKFCGDVIRDNILFILFNNSR